MAILKFREAAEDIETGASNSDRMSAELIEDRGAPNASLS
jgi:hypothetical protein